MEQIGIIIKERRKELGINQQELADLAGDYAEDLQEILSEIEVLNE